jgi:hypothetical protein
LAWLWSPPTSLRHLLLAMGRALTVPLHWRSLRLGLEAAVRLERNSQPSSSNADGCSPLTARSKVAVKFRCVWHWAVSASVAVTPSCATLGCADSNARTIHASSSAGPHVLRVEDAGIARVWWGWSSSAFVQALWMRLRHLSGMCAAVVGRTEGQPMPLAARFG